MEISSDLHLPKDLSSRLSQEGIDPYSLSEKQLDALKAMYGDTEKGHWLASRISLAGVALEIGAVLNVLFNIASLSWLVFMVSITGELLGLSLVYIGFRIQHKISLQKLTEEDDRIN